MTPFQRTNSHDRRATNRLRLRRQQRSNGRSHNKSSGHKNPFKNKNTQRLAQLLLVPSNKTTALSSGYMAGSGSICNENRKEIVAGEKNRLKSLLQSFVLKGVCVSFSTPQLATMFNVNISSPRKKIHPGLFMMVKNEERSGSLRRVKL